MLIGEEVLLALLLICWSGQWLSCLVRVFKIVYLPYSLALIYYILNNLAYIVADIWTIKVGKGRLKVLLSLLDQKFVRLVGSWTLGIRSDRITSYNLISACY